MSTSICTLFIVVLGILLYIPWLGSFGPLDPTDSFFLESGRELVETGNFLLPLNNYQPWLDKPILYFWLVAFSYKLAGISPLVGRLPSALSAISLALVMFHGSRPFLRTKTALLASIIFLSCPLSAVIGHVCLTDMTLTLCISGCLLFLYKGLRSNSNKHLLFGYLFLAGGLLCKGPIAAILCGLSLAIYITLKRQNFAAIKQDLLRLKPIQGLALAVLLNLPWYLAANMGTNGKFFEAFFFTQNFGRMVGTVNHQGPFWFYLPVVAGGLFPWCLLFFSTNKFFQRSIQKAEGEDNPQIDLFRLLFSWFCTIIVLFSVVKTKLPTYILPAVPAFAIMLALQLEVLLRTKYCRRILWTGILATTTILVLAVVHKSFHGYIQILLSDNFWVLPAMILLLIIYTLALFKKRGKLAILALCATTLFACGILVPAGLKAFYKHKQIGFNKLVFIAKEAKANIAILSAEEPSICWITHQPVSRILDKSDAEKYMQSKQNPHYLLAPKEMLKDMGWFAAKETILAAQGKWQLIELSSPANEAK